MGLGCDMVFSSMDAVADWWEPDLASCNGCRWQRLGGRHSVERGDDVVDPTKMEMIANLGRRSELNHVHWRQFGDPRRYYIKHRK